MVGRDPLLSGWQSAASSAGLSLVSLAWALPRQANVYRAVSRGRCYGVVGRPEILCQAGAKVARPGHVGLADPEPAVGLIRIESENHAAQGMYWVKPAGLLGDQSGQDVCAPVEDVPCRLAG